MKSYADSGFLVSLYKRESTSELASQILARAAEPVLLSLLTLLEVRNAFHLSVFRREISEGEREKKWQLFNDDLSRGVFILTPIPNIDLYNRAGELADKYSGTEGSRSLDLLHVAAALLLNADVLLSFDARQRKVAIGEGVKVRPN